MKAIRFHQHGGPEVLRYEDAPTPEPGPGEVLVALRAAALNHLDLFVLRGMPGIPIPLPHVPGSDVAGIVAEVGPGVAEWSPGDRVVADPGLACSACEFCERGESSLCVGDGVSGKRVQVLYAVSSDRTDQYTQYLSSFQTWANDADVIYNSSAAETGGTRNIRVVTKARVLPGEAVLILGIGGGVALAALQIAKHAGARVFVTSSSQEKLDRARAMGADVLINHKATDFSKEVWGITEKRGVDVVIENVGAATWAGSIRALARGGRLVTCGATSGPKPDEDIRRIFTKQITIHGSTMGTRHDWEQLTRLLAAKTFRPVVDRTFPLEQAAQAQTLLEHGEHFGKLVLTIPPLS